MHCPLPRCVPLVGSEQQEVWPSSSHRGQKGCWHILRGVARGLPGGDKTLPREVPRDPIGSVEPHSPYSYPCELAEKHRGKGKEMQECVVTCPSTLCLGLGLLARDLPLPHEGVSRPGVSFSCIWHRSPSFPQSQSVGSGRQPGAWQGEDFRVASGDLTDGLLAWGWEFPAASGPFPAHLQVPDPTSAFPAFPCSPARSQIWPPPPAAAGLPSSPQLTHPLSLFGGSSFQIVGNWDHASSWMPRWAGWIEVLAS